VKQNVRDRAEDRRERLYLISCRVRGFRGARGRRPSHRNASAHSGISPPASLRACFSLERAKAWAVDAASRR